MAAFKELLSGGTLKDSGDSNLVLATLSRSLDRLPELIECLRDQDPLTRARAAAVLERLTRTQPELASSARPEILALARSQELWLARMDVCRMSPLVSWSEDEYEKVLAFLFLEVDRHEGFVAAWALDALARFAAKDDSIRSRVLYLLDEAIATGSAAVRARARKALARLCYQSERCS